MWFQFVHGQQAAYGRDAELASLLVDPEFAAELNDRQAAWRRVVQLAIGCGVSTPAFSASLAYFDSYRRARLPANLTQVSTFVFDWSIPTPVCSICVKFALALTGTTRLFWCAHVRTCRHARVVSHRMDQRGQGRKSPNVGDYTDVFNT
jgi:hypothetical protein